MQYGTTWVAPIARVNVVDNCEKHIYSKPLGLNFDEFIFIIKQSLVLEFHIQDGRQQRFSKANN